MRFTLNRRTVAFAVGFVAFAILGLIGLDAVTDEIDDKPINIGIASNVVSAPYAGGYTAVLTCKITGTNYQVNYCLASHRGENAWDGGLVEIAIAQSLQTFTENNFPWSNAFTSKFQLPNKFRISVRANGDDHCLLKLSIFDQSGNLVFKDEVTEYEITVAEQ